jgi:hypothetical protein
MGKLLIGHFGHSPEAESVSIALRDCHQRLGLKPSDFVSTEPPTFFKKAHGAVGRYLVFQLDIEEIKEAAVWRPGYYLLPLDALDVMKAFGKQALTSDPAAIRPVELECEVQPPVDVLKRAHHWADQSQPLFFQCHCPKLTLRLDPPWGFRRHWVGRLMCGKRCQPVLKTRL